MIEKYLKTEINVLIILIAYFITSIAVSILAVDLNYYIFLFVGFAIISVVCVRIQTNMAVYIAQKLNIRTNTNKVLIEPKVGLTSKQNIFYNMYFSIVGISYLIVAISYSSIPEIVIKVLVVVISLMLVIFHLLRLLKVYPVLKSIKKLEK